MASMSASPMRVAITGAGGLIGSVLADRLDRARFDLVLLGRDEGDITDLEELTRAFEGIDAVVHLAGESEVRASWEDLIDPNLVGARNAFEAARRSGVRRVVFASSNHAVGMALLDPDTFADPDRPRLATADDPVRPDSLYGATKAWGEAIGRYYAEIHGLEVVCLRIGWVTGDDRPPRPEQVARQTPEVARRAPAMWLSHRDCATLVAAALSAEVDFAIVNGVGDNPGRWFSLDEGRDRLGWWPEDRLDR